MNSKRLTLYLNGKPVTNDEEYQEVLGFIEWLEKKIEGKWHDLEKEKYVTAHTKLCETMLGYENQTDKIPF